MLSCNLLCSLLCVVLLFSLVMRLIFMHNLIDTLASLLFCLNLGHLVLPLVKALHMGILCIRLTCLRCGHTWAHLQVCLVAQLDHLLGRLCMPSGGRRQRLLGLRDHCPPILEDGHEGHSEHCEHEDCPHASADLPM